MLCGAGSFACQQPPSSCAETILWGSQPWLRWRFIQFGRILSFSIGFRGSQRTMPGWWPPCTCMASRPSSPSIRLDSPATPALKVFIPPKPPLERRTMHKNAQSRTTAPPPPTRKARHRSSPLDLSIWALIVKKARHSPGRPLTPARKAHPQRPKPAHLGVNTPYPPLPNLPFEMLSSLIAPFWVQSPLASGLHSKLNRKGHSPWL